MRPIDIKILANAARARAEINSLADTSEKTGSRIGGALGKGAKFAALGVAALGAAAVKIGIDSVKAASDSQQSLGATRTVFGKYADDVIARSKKAAEAIGVSANEYRELSNVAGASLKGAGVPLEKVSGLTKDLNGRAADLAATFGGSTKDAVEAFGSLLRGEADPIERYGISVKQSDVNARLAAQGQDKLTGSALKQAEMMARLDLAFAQSKDSQGAFSRESDTLANRQQVLGAKVEDLKAKIGTVLLPVLTQIGTTLIDTVVPAVERGSAVAIKFAQDIGEKAAPIIAKIGDVVRDRVLPILTRFGEFIAGTIAPIVGRLASKVADNLRPAFEAGIATTSKILAKFQQWQPEIEKAATLLVKIAAKAIEFSSKVLGVVLPVVYKFAGFLAGGLIDAIGTAISLIIRIATNAVAFGKDIAAAGTKAGEFATKVKEKIGDAIQYVKDIPSKIKNAVGDLGTTLLSAGKDVIGGLIQGIKDKASDLAATIQSYVIDKIPGPVKKALGINSPSKVFREIGDNLMQGLALGVETSSTLVTTALNKTNAAVKNLLDKRYDGKALDKHIEKAAKATSDEQKALDRVAVKWDALKDKIAAARKAIADYAAATQAAVVESGNVTTLGSREVLDAEGNSTGDVITMSTILEDTEKAAADAERYRLLIADLANRGVNDTTIKQLLAAGVAGGLATAEAIAAGGAESIARLNELTAQLTTTGATLGADMAQKFALLGEESAAGLLTGLLKDEEKIEKAAKKLTRRLIKAVKKALGIASPSKVFRGIARNTVDGLVIDLDDYRVERAGRGLATSLTDAFGKPTLDARLALDARSALTSARASADRTEIRLTAEQLDALSRGKAIDADLAVWRATGGRPSA